MSPRTWVAFAAIVATPFSCASAEVKDGSTHAVFVVPPRVPLVGARCKADVCVCRADGNDAELEPPPAGMKRFEIKASVFDGDAALRSPTLGQFVAKGTRDTCYYVDLVNGSSHTFSFVGRAADANRGFSPKFIIREYGPKGPFWYDVVSAECDNGTGRCDRRGADIWGDSIKKRKRGRLDPCGSAVVTGLDWETSGGLNARDGGNFLDFTVHFSMELKKFSTAFAPGSTECLPK